MAANFNRIGLILLMVAPLAYLAIGIFFAAGHFSSQTIVIVLCALTGSAIGLGITFRDLMKSLGAAGYRRRPMIQASRKRPEGGAMVAFVLLFFAATPALADEFPGGGCVFDKVGPPEYQRGDVQFIPGGARSFVEIYDEAGKPTRCRYSTETMPFHIKCHGQAPEPFSFVGPTMHVQTHDILVFRNVAWYKVCYTPV